MKLKSLCIAISAALAMGTATVTLAEGTMENAKVKTENAVDNAIDKLPPKRTMSRAEYTSQKDTIESAYKTAHSGCDSMTGNAKSVCRVEAKSDEKGKLADLEAQYKGTPAADTDAKVAKARAQYDVAKQKCEDRPSAEQKSCKADAKAEETRAISDAKAAAKTAANN
jgi:hypothetical protein